MANRILIVDDDDILRESLRATLENRGFYCEQAPDGSTAFEKLQEKPFDVVLTDIEMPGMNGLELLEKSGHIQPSTSFIIVTAYGTLETAIEALRKGAFDYLLKPLNFEDVALKIQKLIEHKELVEENQALRKEIHAQYDFSNIIGQSPAIQKVFETIRQVSDSDSNILITGKSGTGKELVAKAIHYNSVRRKGHFVALNCGAITETLFESELFGHKKGSFTGAVSDKQGLFVAAHRGTLFLDEISEMSLTAQAKLLRAIETREILPVGATQSIKVDVRLIAATNRDLFHQVQTGAFREDLYYRLNVIEIHLPSLKERRDDIPLLVRHFIQKYNRQMNKRIKDIEPRALQALMERDWQGEVRELENTIERLMIFAKGDYLTFADLPPDLCGPSTSLDGEGEGQTLKRAVEDFERQYIQSQLQRHHFHRGETAKALGIGEATLYRKMSALGIKVNPQN